MSKRFENSFELLVALKKIGYIKNERDPYWWPHSGTFLCFISTILTQNTKWENVQKALLNLETKCITDLDSLILLKQDELAALIKPVGFYNTKSKRILDLAFAIKKRFENLKNFCNEVTREWLLAQKGLGAESVDAILNYVCYKDEMVVDSYTARLLHAFGYELNEYDEIKEWLQKGILQHLSKIEELYQKKMPLAQIYARFHGKIVEYVKENSKARVLDIKPLLKGL